MGPAPGRSSRALGGMVSAMVRRRARRIGRGRCGRRRGRRAATARGRRGGPSARGAPARRRSGWRSRARSSRRRSGVAISQLSPRAGTRLLASGAARRAVGAGRDGVALWPPWCSRPRSHRGSACLGSVAAAALVGGSTRCPAPTRSGKIVPGACGHGQVWRDGGAGRSRTRACGGWTVRYTMNRPRVPANRWPLSLWRRPYTEERGAARDDPVSWPFTPSAS